MREANSGPYPAPPPTFRSKLLWNPAPFANPGKIGGTPTGSGGATTGGGGGGSGAVSPSAATILQLEQIEINKSVPKKRQASLPVSLYI